MQRRTRRLCGQREFERMSRWPRPKPSRRSAPTARRDEPSARGPSRSTHAVSAAEGPEHPAVPPKPDRLVCRRGGYHRVVGGELGVVDEVFVAPQLSHTLAVALLAAGRAVGGGDLDSGLRRERIQSAVGGDCDAAGSAF